LIEGKLDHHGVEISPIEDEGSQEKQTRLYDTNEIIEDNTASQEYIEHNGMQ
jgi:hypothetical protein